MTEIPVSTASAQVTAPLDVQVRRAGVADVPALAPLFDAYRQFYDQAPDVLRAQQFLQDRLSREESWVWLAQHDGRAMGLCQCYPTFCSVEAAPILALYDLYVCPTARGLGLARALMQAAEAQAQVLGYVRLDLTTAKTNRPAQTLYRSLGWVRDEVFDAYHKAVATPFATAC